MENTDDQFRARFSNRDIEEELKDHVAEGKTIGKYKIGPLLAEGGMGAVYLAEDITLGRKVALKVIKYPTLDVESRRIMQARFDREARGAGRVSHPNVVTVHAYEQIGGQPLLIMEYVDGHPLKDELQGGKALKPGRVARIIVEILKGLEAVHKAGLIHRDLKPANIMLARDGGEAKILDLGLVKFAESEDPANDQTVTQAGVPMGTRFYMSPEQINARPEARSIDGRADIYAVGVMCFHLLTGRPPFDGVKSPIFDQHRLDPMPKMVSPFGELPPAFKAIVEKAMAKKPGDRFQTAGEMREALERMLRPPAQKRSAVSAISLALAIPAIVAIGAAVLTFGPWSGSKAPAAKARTVENAVSSREAAAAPTAQTSRAADTSAISVPPPPADDVVPTTKAGCQAYETGRTGEATVALEKVIAATPRDAEALYCLCGAYARKPSLASSERGVCESFLKYASRRDERKMQVGMWLKRGVR